MPTRTGVINTVTQRQMVGFTRFDVYLPYGLQMYTTNYDTAKRCQALAKRRAAATLDTCETRYGELILTVEATP